MFNNDTNLGINDYTVQEALWGILISGWSREDTALESIRVKTYAQAGVLSGNKGLVITLPDGSEFQVTIIQSR